MRQLLNIFVDICLLRAGPQDLPGSSFLLAISACAGLITGTVVIVGTFGSLADALMAQLLDIVLLLALLRAGLGLAGKQARFLQTASALLGSGAFINLVTMPLELVVEGDPSGSPLGELGMLLYLALIVWALIVVGHIVRNAFEMPFWSGVLIALNYFFMVNWLIQALFFPG